MLGHIRICLVRSQMYVYVLWQLFIPFIKRNLLQKGLSNAVILWCVLSWYWHTCINITRFAWNKIFALLGIYTVWNGSFLLKFCDTILVLKHWRLTASLSHVKFQKSTDLITGFVCCFGFRIWCFDSRALQWLVNTSVLSIQVWSLCCSVTWYAVTCSYFVVIV